MTSRPHPIPAVHLAPPQGTRGEPAPNVRRHTEMREQWADEALAYAEGLRCQLEVMLRELSGVTSGPSPCDGAGREGTV